MISQRLISIVLAMLFLARQGQSFGTSLVSFLPYLNVIPCAEGDSFALVNTWKGTCQIYSANDRSARFDIPNVGACISVGGQIYALTDDRIYRVGVPTGDLSLIYASAAPFAYMANSETTILVRQFNPISETSAIDISSGKIMWKSAEQNPLILYLGNERAYEIDDLGPNYRLTAGTSEEWDVSCVSLKKGTRIWKLKTPMTLFREGFTLENDNLFWFFDRNKNAVFSYTAEDGRLFKAYPFPGLVTVDFAGQPGTTYLLIVQKEEASHLQKTGLYTVRKGTLAKVMDTDFGLQPLIGSQLAVWDDPRLLLKDRAATPDGGRHRVRILNPSTGRVEFEKLGVYKGRFGKSIFCLDDDMLGQYTIWKYDVQNGNARALARFSWHELFSK